MAIDASSVGFLAAFAAGAVSFLSPCVLPLVPGYVSYVAGQSAAGERDSLRTLGLSLCFVLGFTTVFVAFGAGASALGFALLAHREALNLASGLLVILFGLFTAGLLRPAWLQRELRWHGDPPGQGPVAAYLLGTAFAFGWTPCIGPVLGAILAVTASSAAGKGVADPTLVRSCASARRRGRDGGDGAADGDRPHERRGFPPRGGLPRAWADRLRHGPPQACC
jgi:cytochrome c-type biogenesis protein